jgi:hypothetical protein
MLLLLLLDCRHTAHTHPQVLVHHPFTPSYKGVLGALFATW